MFSRNDPAFYVGTDIPQVQFSDGTHYVIRAGELSVKFRDKDGSEYLIKDTAGLESHGVDTDRLIEWLTAGEDLDWIHNPWWEVRSETDNALAEVFDNLEEAVRHAKALTEGLTVSK